MNDFVNSPGDPRGFDKRRHGAPSGFFEAEAAGLSWLSVPGGVRTVQVIDLEPGHIVLETVDEVPPTRDAARAFGAQLSVTHSAGAEAFGAPPDHWSGPLFIGNRSLPPAFEPTWGAFYARYRVLPYLDIALDVGGITPRQAEVVHAACARIEAGDFDDGAPPSRVHGDLWTGNVLWSADGVVLIDPAAHGGHRETDLAMLALFGCPFLEEITAGYETASPLRPGWRARTPLHQLHPLAVHAAGHGAAYGRALEQAAEAVLELPAARG
ncbi:fructosamine kinase family protein [Cryobacterium arcticum]|uniref:Fructosamine kinase n=1 Tax=Cryobacterium arcticum TaxID=670052 RepID=A0A318A158_9MICO|nr:fructosamine kinase family protein [Cryobacterium arcticum]PXA70834.1 fructosamine kinase [Cryobacterium arcticum]